MTLTMVAWVFAVVGAIMACILMIAEYWGVKTPPWFPLKVWMWGRFVLMHLAGVIWLIFTNM